MPYIRFPWLLMPEYIDQVDDDQRDKFNYAHFRYDRARQCICMPRTLVIGSRAH